MQKADRRRIARRQDRSLAQPVQARRARRKATVRNVGVDPLVGIVAPRVPLDAVHPGELLVQLANPGPFHPAKLLDRTARRRLRAEAQPVHRAHHPEPRGFVQRGRRLVEQPVRASAPRLAGGIQPHAPLAHPHDQAPHPRRQGNRRVGDAGARLQHQAGEPADRNLHPRAVRIDENERAVDHVHLPVLQEDDRRPVLQGNRPQRNEGRLVAHRALTRPGG